VLINASRELRAHGHAEAARAVVERLLVWEHGEGDKDSTSALEAEILAGALYHAGRYAEARAIYRRLLGDQPGKLPWLGFAGATAAREGDRNAALEASARLDTMSDPYLRGANTYWQAEISALLGDERRAVALLRRSFREGQPVAVRVHSDPDFESLRDNPEYRRLIAPR
jgi:tetratricopeptide (TPR) repeat protein